MQIHLSRLSFSYHCKSVLLAVLAFLISTSWLLTAAESFGQYNSEIRVGAIQLFIIFTNMVHIVGKTQFNTFTFGTITHLEAFWLESSMWKYEKVSFCRWVNQWIEDFIICGMQKWKMQHFTPNSVYRLHVWKIGCRYFVYPHSSFVSQDVKQVLLSLRLNTRSPVALFG